MILYITSVFSLVCDAVIVDAILCNFSIFQPEDLEQLGQEQYILKIKFLLCYVIHSFSFFCILYTLDTLYIFSIDKILRKRVTSSKDLNFISSSSTAFHFLVLGLSSDHLVNLVGESTLFEVPGIVRDSTSQFLDFGTWDVDIFE